MAPRRVVLGYEIFSHVYESGATSRVRRDWPIERIFLPNSFSLSLFVVFEAVASPEWMTVAQTREVLSASLRFGVLDNVDSCFCGKLCLTASLCS